jgi:hypothetical protein
VVDYACSVNLTAFPSDFASFDPPSTTSRVGGWGVDVLGNGKVEIAITLVYGQIYIEVFTHCVPLTCWRALHNVLAASSVSTGGSPTGVVNFFVPTDSDVCLLLVPT